MIDFRSFKKTNQAESLIIRDISMNQFYGTMRGRELNSFEMCFVYARRQSYNMQLQIFAGFQNRPEDEQANLHLFGVTLEEKFTGTDQIMACP
jgi:hypothetical protein